MKLNLTVFHVVASIDKYNGASLQARNLVKHLDSICCNFLICSADVSRLTVRKHHSLNILELPKSGWKRYVALLTAFVRYKPKIVHIHGFWIGVDILFVAWVLRAKTVLKTTLNGVDDYQTIAKASHLKCWLATRVDVCNALVAPIAKINQRYIGEHRTLCIPNLVNCPPVCVPLEQKSNLVLVVGSVIERKGIDRAIVLFNEQLAEDRDAQMVVVGGYDPNDAYYKSCVKQIPEHLAEKIHFVGNLNHSALDLYYQNAKALFLLSDAEGLPNVVLEAMAYNCVPVVTPLNGIAACIIPDDSLGIIFDPRISLSWALFDEMISTGKIFEWVKSSFSADVVLNKYHSLYGALAENKRSYAPIS